MAASRAWDWLTAAERIDDDAIADSARTVEADVVSLVVDSDVMVLYRYESMIAILERELAFAFDSASRLRDLEVSHA